jgi:hypothetical protein
MATNLENREPLQSAEIHHGQPEPNLPCTSGPNGKCGGYIVYLTSGELREAFPRAIREHPEALVHFEHQDNDLWSLEVYMSEAAKRVYLRHCFYRRKALRYLHPLFPGERLPDAQ